MVWFLWGLALWELLATSIAARIGRTHSVTLSFVMAARHADVVVAAFSVVGACPASLRPKDKSRAAPVVAYHGTADEVIAIRDVRDSVAAWGRAGSEARLREYAGVGHTATDAMHADLDADMHQAIKR